MLMAFYVARMKGRCGRAVKRQEATGLDEGGARAGGFQSAEGSGRRHHGGTQGWKAAYQ